MATAQEFDALDGLTITGSLDVGANVAVDTNVLYVDTVNNRVGINKVPTVAFDVSGAVAITSGTISGLTSLGVGNLSASLNTITGTAGITLDAVGDITLDAGDADIALKDDGTQYGALTNSSGNLIIKSGSTTALTFAGANVTLAGNTTIADGKKIDFGSVMDITASATGATFSANTYHGGSIVANGDTNTYLRFNSADSFQITTGGTVRLTANNSGVTIPGALLFDSVASDTPFYETINTTATRSINLNNGSAVICTATGGGTVTFTMPTSPGTNSFAWTVKFNNSGSLTWPASVQWAEGVQPPESSGTDIYSFVTYDGGTTIYGSLAVRNAS